MIKYCKKKIRKYQDLLKMLMQYLNLLREQKAFKKGRYEFVIWYPKWQGFFFGRCVWHTIMGNGAWDWQIVFMYWEFRKWSKKISRK